MPSRNSRCNRRSKASSCVNCNGNTPFATYLRMDCLLPIREETMFFEIVRSQGLSHTSYLVGSQGRAAVIDPRRDCGIYLDIAERADLVITHIFETHRNEDYVIGSSELAAQCGARIYHGSQLPFAYGNPVHEGDRFPLGSLTLSVLETPGHTEESISLVLVDREVSDDPFMVFTGDTLFAGDIARTDFFGRERRAEMAGKIFDSICNKILPLGDGVIVCPAHGAGSVCGGEIADHPFTTIGYERKTNRFLKMKRGDFARLRVEESPYVPPYFRRMEEYNLKGAPLLHGLPRPPRLGIPSVQDLRAHGAQVLDIRSPTSFAAGHIPGSLSIWRDGVPAFAGWYLEYGRPVVIVDDFNLDTDMVVRSLVRLGYDTIAGSLAGGFPAWSRGAQETGSLNTCSVQQLRDGLETEPPFLLDVRDIRNYRSIGHIRGAHHCYVGELARNLGQIPKNRPVTVICEAGYKGSLAASVLAMNGYRSVTNVLGGMQAWVKAGFPVER